MCKDDDKKKPIFGLEKLPDKTYTKLLEAHIRALEIDRGKSHSYIQELEYTIGELKKLKPEDKRLLARDKTIKELKSEVAKLAHKNYLLVRDGKNFIEKILKLKQQLEDEKNKQHNPGRDS